jgi:hypothetical protein
VPGHLSCLLPFIGVVQPIELTDCDDVSKLRRVYRTERWTVHLQGEMGAKAMIVGYILCQQSVEMPFM